jgi:hypothetical protein
MDPVSDDYKNEALDTTHNLPRGLQDLGAPEEVVSAPPHTLFGRDNWNLWIKYPNQNWQSTHYFVPRTPLVISTRDTGATWLKMRGDHKTGWVKISNRSPFGDQDGISEPAVAGIITGWGGVSGGLLYGGWDTETIEMDDLARAFGALVKWLRENPEDQLPAGVFGMVTGMPLTGPYDTETATTADMCRIIGGLNNSIISGPPPYIGWANPTGFYQKLPGGLNTNIITTAQMSRGLGAVLSEMWGKALLVT